MRFAAIDTGTNSTRLLIAEILPDINCNYKKNPDTAPERFILSDLVREMHITRLGGNLGKTKMIDRKNAEKTAAVLKKYLSLINRYKVSRYRAVGTRVLRQAENASWFKDYIMDMIGMELEIISPQQEALLSFTGAVGPVKPALLLKNKDALVPGNAIASLPFYSPYHGVEDKKVTDKENKYNESNSGEILVMDIGGGSTEFITGSLSEGITFSESINIGSVNISEKFIKDSLPGPGDLIKMGEFIRGKIKGIIQAIRQKQLQKVIGLAGTVSALASVDLELERYDMERLNGHKLEFKNIIKIQEKFCSLNLDDRKNIKGLEPERADIIIGGTAILIEIMKNLEIQKINVSENDILDGIIYSIF